MKKITFSFTALYVIYVLAILLIIIGSFLMIVAVGISTQSQETVDQTEYVLDATKIKENYQAELAEYNGSVKDWNCRLLITCPNVDWRFNNPDYVCTYEQTVLHAVTNPERPGRLSYGEHCEEI